MRTVTYGAAVSLDGYMANPDQSLDWLLWSDEVAEITGGYWQTVDTVVMGRRTWEVAAKAGTMVYPNVANYLCSRTITAPPDARLTLAPDAPQLVRALKQQQGGDICIMGGGEIARTLLNADLIDRLGLNLHPVLLGAGIRLIPEPTPRSPWVLREHRILSTGCVYLLYEKPA